MTLRRRVLLATVSVAVIAVVVTAVAALQLVRSVDTTAARQQLSAQVERLASAAPATRTAIVQSLSQLEGEVLVGVSDGEGDGDVSGSAAGILPKRVLVQLRAGDEVSTTIRAGGENYLVEGRPLEGGGSVVGAVPSSRVLGVGSSLWLRILIALGIGLLVAALAALLLSRLLTRPLTRLASAARRMAAGERDVPLEPSGIAEVTDVESALTSLDAALARSEGRQREFLLSISHDLRTPLTAIRGYAEALSDGVVPAGDVAEVGRTLVAESERLTAFTSDLLALARLESDDFSLDLTEVDAGEVLRSAATAWGGAASTAQVELEVTAPETPVGVRADAVRLRQVVDGLLENALRVSPAGSRIHLALSADSAAVQLSISDGGPGLTPADAADAFERGRLHERYRAVRAVGTGLGLSIAARLVERMGGTITAHSHPGAGAEFRIRLPKR
ncbi:HAMP domain-containing sensor histidine kinase [soil metagenome]